MKVTICLVVFLLAFISCQQTDEELVNKQRIAGGYYEGWFEYGDNSYWCLIQFDDDRYEEWPSGGVLHQKSMACLTKGTYRVDGDRLVFAPGTLKHEGFPDSCDANTLLPGSYKMMKTGRQDSLVFTKGEGDSRIIYHLVNRTTGGKS